MIGCCQIASVHLAIRKSQIASDYSAIYYRQIIIAYLATKERQIAITYFSNSIRQNTSNCLATYNAKWQQSFSNAGVVMLRLSSQNKGIRVANRTPPTKDLLKSQTMALTAMMRG